MLADSWDFVKQMLPEEVNFPPRPSEQQSAAAGVAVLCNANYVFADGAVMNHWLPGWMQDDIETGGLLFDQCVAEATQSFQDEEQAMTQKLELCTAGNADVAMSLRNDIAELQAKSKNFFHLQKTLWEEHKILVRSTVGDGNCGIEMCYHFGCGKPAVAVGKAAPRSDLLPVLAAERQELKAAWLQVSQDPFWKEVFAYFCKDILLEEEKKVAEKKMVDQKKSEMTPPRRQAAPPPSSTPPNVSQKSKKRRLMAMADSPITGVSVVVSADAEQKEEKKKRTGRPLAPHEVITFDNYFERLLSDLGLTYRKWVTKHREEVVIVCLALKLDAKRGKEGVHNFKLPPSSRKVISNPLSRSIEHVFLQQPFEHSYPTWV